MEAEDTEMGTVNWAWYQSQGCLGNPGARIDVLMYAGLGEGEHELRARLNWFYCHLRDGLNHGAVKHQALHVHVLTKILSFANFNDITPSLQRLE